MIPGVRRENHIAQNQQESWWYRSETTAPSCLQRSIQTPQHVPSNAIP